MKAQERAPSREVVRRDSLNRVISLAEFDRDGHATLIDGIGAKTRYAYTEGDHPISVTYLDEHDKVIPVEVEVREVVSDGWAEKTGLQRGDRLLAYDGEKLHSKEQLVFLTGRERDGKARKVTWRRAEKTYVAEAPAGRLGVLASNVRAAPPAR